jgi:hypothetical protein
MSLPVAPTAPSQIQLPFLGADLLSELASGFAYYRGGVRWTVGTRPGSDRTVIGTLEWTDSTTTQLGVVPNTSTFSVKQNAITLAGSLPSYNRLVAIDHNLETGGDFLVPYYGKTPYRFTHLRSGDNPDIPISDDVLFERLSIFCSGDQFYLDRGLYRGAADDFQFSFFQGFIGYL